MSTPMASTRQQSSHDTAAVAPYASGNNPGGLPVWPTQPSRLRAIKNVTGMLILAVLVLGAGAARAESSTGCTKGAPCRQAIEQGYKTCLMKTRQKWRAIRDMCRKAAKAKDPKSCLQAIQSGYQTSLRSFDLPSASVPLRVRVVTTMSQDPNDSIADPIDVGPVQIGPVTVTTGRSECPDGRPCSVDADCAPDTCSAEAGIAHVTVPGDSNYVISLQDPLVTGQMPADRVGFVNFYPSSGSAPNRRCAPTDGQGDVTVTFLSSDANPAADVDYTAGIRIVPIDAPTDMQNPEQDCTTAASCR